MNNVAVTQERLNELEVIIRSTEPAAKQWLECWVEIHETKAYLTKGFKSFEAYSLKCFPNSFRTIKTAIQVAKIRKQLTDGQHAAPDPDQQTQALAATLSDRAILELAKAPKAKRTKILMDSAAKSNGKPSAKAIASEITRSNHKRSQPEVNITNISQSGAYSSPSKEPTTPHSLLQPLNTPATAVHQPITDPESAIAAILSVYERDKPWFNDLSTGRPRTPRDVIDRLTTALQGWNHPA